MDSHTRSVEVARLMLKGAVWALKQEQILSRDRRRLDGARANVAFWRERMRQLVLSTKA